MLDRVILRPAEPNDLSDLAELAYLSWEAGILPLLEDRPGLRERERRRFAGYVSEALPRIVVATHDDEIVGWCSRGGRGRAYIPFLFVAPYMQHAGIGSALLRRNESVFEMMGFDRVVLETPADHVDAVSFYQHQGYRILAMRPEGPGGPEPLQSVRLEKSLNPYRGPVEDD
ncbi:MAG: GNAT family N-acetyltransferase [Alphaproteobacteria bacterium]|nr:GNAT family N-acetyltransferase [Alphaproteobacteria bacterium]